MRSLTTRKPRFSSSGTRSESGSDDAARKDLQVDAGLVVAFAAVEVDGAGPRFGELFEDADVDDAPRRR